MRAARGVSTMLPDCARSAPQEMNELRIDTTDTSLNDAVLGVFESSGRYAAGRARTSHPPERPSDVPLISPAHAGPVRQVVPEDHRACGHRLPGAGVDQP